MDWMHCNLCFRLPSGDANVFFISSCGHIFCQSCCDNKAATVASDPTVSCPSVTCAICQKENIQLMAIGSSMDPGMKKFFQSPLDHLLNMMPRLRSVYEFQANQAEQWKKVVEARLEKAKELYERYQEKSRQALKHKKEMDSLTAELAETKDALRKHCDYKEVLESRLRVLLGQCKESQRGETSAAVADAFFGTPLVPGSTTQKPFSPMSAIATAFAESVVHNDGVRERARTSDHGEGSRGSASFHESTLMPSTCGRFPDPARVVNASSPACANTSNSSLLSLVNSINLTQQQANARRASGVGSRDTSIERMSHGGSACSLHHVSQPGDESFSRFQSHDMSGSCMPATPGFSGGGNNSFNLFSHTSNLATPMLGSAGTSSMSMSPFSPAAMAAAEPYMRLWRGRGGALLNSRSTTSMRGSVTRGAIIPRVNSPGYCSPAFPHK